MTKEEKQLLLKDLCARIPYHTLVQLNPGAYNKPETCLLCGVDGEKVYLNVDSDPFRVDHIKPYLRPMSSMTEEERKEYNKTRAKIAVQWDDYGTPIGYEYAYTIKTFDWLNKHHFDFRNLIEKGLALEAKEDMYTKTKEE